MFEKENPIEIASMGDLAAAEELGKEIVADRILEHLTQCAIHDPVYRYEREQDHFIRHAPKWEIQNWIEWNRRKRATNKNAFGATETEAGKLGSMRDLGEVPYYLDHYMTAFDECFWKDAKKVRAFFKRNPLFCTAEAI